MSSKFKLNNEYSIQHTPLMIGRLPRDIVVSIADLLDGASLGALMITEKRVYETIVAQCDQIKDKYDNVVLHIFRRLDNIIPIFRNIQCLSQATKHCSEDQLITLFNSTNMCGESFQNSVIVDMLCITACELGYWNAYRRISNIEQHLAETAGWYKLTQYAYVVGKHGQIEMFDRFTEFFSEIWPDSFEEMVDLVVVPDFSHYVLAGAILAGNHKLIDKIMMYLREVVEEFDDNIGEILCDVFDKYDSDELHPMSYVRMIRHVPLETYEYCIVKYDMEFLLDHDKLADILIKANRLDIIKWMDKSVYSYATFHPEHVRKMIINGQHEMAKYTLNRLSNRHITQSLSVTLHMLELYPDVDAEEFFRKRNIDVAARLTLEHDNVAEAHTEFLHYGNWRFLAFLRKTLFHGDQTQSEPDSTKSL